MKSPEVRLFFGWHEASAKTHLSNEIFYSLAHTTSSIKEGMVCVFRG
jgi:hypothetical protein